MAWLTDLTQLPSQLAAIIALLQELTLLHRELIQAVTGQPARAASAPRVVPRPARKLSSTDVTVHTRSSLAAVQAMAREQSQSWWRRPDPPAGAPAPPSPASAPPPAPGAADSPPSS